MSDLLTAVARYRDIPVQVIGTPIGSLAGHGLSQGQKTVSLSGAAVFQDLEDLLAEALGISSSGLPLFLYVNNQYRPECSHSVGDAARLFGRWEQGREAAVLTVHYSVGKPAYT